MKPFWQGFLNYKYLPKVYAAGKILVDDATFVVNEWGSVNSRVFDGAASGILVLTNGVEGSQSTFEGLIPTFQTKEELSDLLEKYLRDDELRQKKIKQIQDYVLAHHTYGHRAEQLLDILEKELARKIVNLKATDSALERSQKVGRLSFRTKLEARAGKARLKRKTADPPRMGCTELRVR